MAHSGARLTVSGRERQPGVDGLFVGRAGLDPQRFAAIVRTPLPIRAPASS